MKTLISLFALFLSLTLTAQTNPATWYSNDTSESGIQSPTNTASGYASTAMGEGTTASGSRSTAMGRGTTASGNYSTAMGYYTTASISYSTAMGHQTTASGYVSTAMGTQTTASGSRSTAMGEGTTASGGWSTAMGLYTIASDRSSLVIGEYNLLGSTVTNSATQFSTDNTAFVIGNGADSDNRSDALMVLFNGDATLAGSMTATSFIGDGSQLSNLPFRYNNNELWGIQAHYSNSASGSFSTAMGEGTTASGNYSTAMGHFTTASGDYSTAIGAVTTAEDYMTVALGTHNKTDETPNPNEFSFQNTAFVIGNGGFANDGSYIGTPESYSNAFEVLFDGTTTIAGDLNVNSDARLKANIVSLGRTLAKLLQIDGKSYTMKKDENKKQKIGLLAQDIEKVFPELVSESHGVKSVNYQGLVPVLINALKEQEERIKRLEELLLN